MTEKWNPKPLKRKQDQVGGQEKGSVGRQGGPIGTDYLVPVSRPLIIHAPMNTEHLGGTPRVAELDGLRGLAAALIVAVHSLRGFHAAGAVDGLIFSVGRFGWIGVDLFFVLSGYLITGLLLDAQGSRHGVVAFYARRALRIFPPYYFLLLLLFVIGPAAGVNLAGRSAADWPWFALYGSNLLMLQGAWPDPALVPLWSLAVEEHFYLLWPLLLHAVPERRRLATIASLALGSAVLRTALLVAGWDKGDVYVFTLTRLDGLALGSALAVVMRRRGPALAWLRTTAGPVAGSAVVAGLVLVAFNRVSWEEWSRPALAVGFLAVALGMTAILAFVVTREEGHGVRRVLAVTPLQAMGRLSYGMYLFHGPVIEMARKGGLDPVSFSPQSGAVWPWALGFTIAVLLVTMALAEVSWRIVETPFLKLKRHFPYEQTDAAQANR